jgi:hypothetical protein
MIAKNRTLKSLCLIVSLLPFGAFAKDHHEYKVSDKLHNGDFVINGMTWRPAKVCPHINKGDTVVFSQGNRNGHSV